MRVTVTEVYGILEVMKKFVTSIFLPLFCACGGVLIFFVTYTADFRDWRDSDSWATTQSTHFAISPKTSTATYSYTVDDQEYTNGRTHFFTIQDQDPRWSEWQVAHTGLEQVTVYYDPDAPQRSVLVPTADLGMVVYSPVMWALLCFTLMAPFAVWAFYLRWLRHTF